MNAWKSVFLQSPVNDGHYDEDRLPQLAWNWPKGTWFQVRLYFIRERQPVMSFKSRPKVTHSDQMETV